MQLFYAPEIEPPCHTLGEEESKHCIRVLRLGVGERLHLTDGRGNLSEAEITDADPRRCTVRVVATHAEFEKMPYALTMCVAPTKNPDRYEWFLEKATEVGVTEIVPIETAHSERRSFKPQRGEKVITAAMKQSLKAYRPVEVAPTVGQMDLVAAGEAEHPYAVFRFLLAERMVRDLDVGGVK